MRGEEERQRRSVWRVVFDGLQLVRLGCVAWSLEGCLANPLHPHQHHLLPQGSLKMSTWWSGSYCVCLACVSRAAVRAVPVDAAVGLVVFALKTDAR